LVIIALELLAEDPRGRLQRDDSLARKLPHACKRVAKRAKDQGKTVIWTSNLLRESVDDNGSVINRAKYQEWLRYLTKQLREMTTPKLMRLASKKKKK